MQRARHPASLERWDIYELDTLASTLTASFAELQADVEAVAAPSFLGLLKVTLGKSARSLPPETPSSTSPQSPFTEAPPFFSPSLHPPPPMLVPIVITIQVNGKLIGERTTPAVPPTATWEAVARARIEVVASVEEVSSYMSMPLSVSLFPDAEHSPADRVGAGISDTVATAGRPRLFPRCTAKCALRGPTRAQPEASRDHGVPARSQPRGIRDPPLPRPLTFRAL